jgi:hypothetical protein
MTTARSHACAVLLADGRAVVAGGETAAGALSSAEILEPGGRFRPAASMPSAHSSAACGLLPDGTVMVAGGRVAGGFTNAVEIYDPAANRWSGGPAMSEARAGATASVLPDGRMLIAGGETAAGPSASLEIYDPAAAAFHPLPARLSSPRVEHAAAPLPDGRVLIAGGSDGNKSLDSVDVFDPVTEQVSAAAKLSSPRAGLSATALLDGRVLIAGGSDGKTEAATAEIFDPESGTWSVEAGMKMPRRDHVAVVIPGNNTVLIAGGTATTRQVSEALAATEVYIPWRHEFRAIGSLEAPKTAAAAVALAVSGKVTLAGGRNGSGTLASAETVTVPTIVTDRSYNASGDTVRISGSGWAPGQKVQLDISEAAEAGKAVSIAATADENGTWSAVSTMPEMSGREAAIYITGTQEYFGARGRSNLLTARVASSSTPAKIVVSTDCKSTTPTTFAFGSPVCAAVSGVTSKTSVGEQLAWISPSGTMTVIRLALVSAVVQNTQVPNGGGVWTLKAYPGTGCTSSNGIWSCSGTPDVTATFSVGSGALGFTTPAITLPVSGCSSALGLQIQTSSNAAVAPTFPTVVTLTSSSATGRFSTASGCTATVTSLTIPAGASSASFYYSDTSTTSTATLSASASSLAGASQTSGNNSSKTALSATHLSVSAPSTATAGTSFQFTVTALDASNNKVSNYSGTVQFASNDAQAVLPAAAKLSSGSGTFTATLKTAGARTISAADSTTSSISGTAAITVSAAAAASISATAGTPQSATVNTAFASPLQATVKDSYGNAVSGATITFTAPSSGASALLNGTATTNSSGVAFVTATANSTPGSYTVAVRIASATAAFLLTNLAAAGPPQPAASLQLNGTVAGSYSVPNASPYNSIGSFYIDFRISNWGRQTGGCANLIQFLTSPQYGPSRIMLCDPSYGWGAITVGEYIDGTAGGSPVWLQAPNIAILGATATNPMTLALAGPPFPVAMGVGRTIMISKAAGTGCSGMNGNQTITAVSGNTITIQYDGTGCSYTANSGIALSQDFVFRYHRDVAAQQLIGEVWNVDGTGHSAQALGMVNTAPIVLPGVFQIGDNGVTGNLAYLRWYSGTIPVGAPAPSGSSGGDLADWEFENNGKDSSGHHLDISFASQPTYVASPSYAPACSAGVSQSFRVGQPATLDGSGSFPLDGGTALTYSWSQIPSVAAGAPLQNLTWSATNVAQPTVTGFGFGPMNFQLTVTQGDGQSTTCTVHDGAVTADGNNVVVNATGNATLDKAIATLIGPQVQLGRNPWPFYDQAAAADAAVQIADMDVDYFDYWDIADPGTVTVTTGSHLITGVGTRFTTSFCQAPANPSTPKPGASIIVWYPTGRTLNGVPETGRRRMDVTSCNGDTQLSATVSDNNGWMPDAPAGAGLSYTAEFYNHVWEFNSAPANYYDNVQAYYALYYRSGIDTYLAAARKLADRFWTSPEIDRGLAFNVGDWFGAQNGRSNSISGLVLRALDTFDGHLDMWAGLHNVWSYTDWLLTQAYPLWSTGGGVDGREFGYTLAQAAYGALFDTDPTWQAYCRSMIESSFQPGAPGIWPKTLDAGQHAWLQWVEMKSTFDSGAAWNGSTVTLTNGSNVVACSTGNCGWQASDFAAYDANNGNTCSSGASCATVPVLFTDSATWPADSTHTDSVSYCYPNACTFIDSNHFTLDRPYAGPSGTHGWVFGVSGGSLGGNVSGVVGYGSLPYMQGILSWGLDLAGKAMACSPTGGPSNCDDATATQAFSYSGMAVNWIVNYGLVPSAYGASYFAGFPACGTAVGAGNLWCNRNDTSLQSREMMGDAYRGLAAAYRRSPSPALKTVLDNWYSGMWAKPGTNPLVASPDGQYDVSFDPTGCPGCGYYLNDGAPYSQKFFGQHFGISNEGGWPAVRLGY